MSRRIRCLRKSDYTLPEPLDYPYLAIVKNGKRVVNPKTGQPVVMPDTEFGMIEQAKLAQRGITFKPIRLTDKQIQRSHVVGVDEKWTE